MTHGAVVTSLMRYGSVIAGSCMPLEFVAKMETHPTRVAARRIGGMERSTRTEGLRFLAATTSYKNMYFVHCAELADSALRADGSTKAARPRKELAAILRADAMGVGCAEIAPPTGRRAK